MGGEKKTWLVCSCGRIVIDVLLLLWVENPRSLGKERSPATN